MKKYLITLLIGLFILCPMRAKAILCNNSLKVKYQEMSKNITVNYEYTESDNDIAFNIKIANIPQDFIIVNYNTNEKYYYNNSEIVIPNVSKNTSYKFDIMKNDDACSWEVFYTHYITIPPYNSYYKDDICKGIEDYKLCNKWLEININYDEWKNKVQTYKDSLNKQVIEKESVKELTIFDKIINFYTDYYMFILPSLIVLCLIGRFIYNKKHDLF